MKPIRNSILTSLVVALTLSCTHRTLMSTSNLQPLHFTTAQQEFFVKNIKYYMYFSMLLRSKMQPDEIQRRYNLKPASTTKYLTKLQEIGLISVDVSNHVTIISSGDYETWNHNEPMGLAYDRGFIDTLLDQTQKPQSDPEHADAIIGVLTLTNEQKDNFVDEFLKLKAKYRALSNDWNACKKDCATVKHYATGLIVGEEQFNKHFYPTVDDDI